VLYERAGASQTVVLPASLPFPTAQKRVRVYHCGSQNRCIADANVSVGELAERANYKAKCRTIISVVIDQSFLKLRIV
jgi:virulence-associated protein VagC